MNPKAIFSVGALLLAVGLTASLAHAGEKASLSSLPLLGEKKNLREAKMGVTGISVKERVVNGSKYLDVSTDTKNGYCVVDRAYNFRLSSTSISSTENNELWHFTEDAEKKTASLERIYIDLPIGEKTFYAMTAKTTIQLTRIGRGTNVTAWAFREANGDVTVLATNGNDGRETASKKGEEVGETITSTSSDCSFGAVRILGTQLKSGGSVAQLRGNLPPVGEGKAKIYPRFTIDMSVAKVGRDPEPILSVRVRESEI